MTDYYGEDREPTHTAVTLTFAQLVSLGLIATSAIAEEFLNACETKQKRRAVLAHQAMGEIIIAMAETWPERHNTEQIAHAAARKLARDEKTGAWAE